jgi:hypothetical protein
MTKPIPATPTARGEDARRIRGEMSADRPVSPARIEANRKALQVARSAFRNLHGTTVRGKRADHG